MSHRVTTNTQMTDESIVASVCKRQGITFTKSGDSLTFTSGAIRNATLNLKTGQIIGDTDHGHSVTVLDSLRQQYGADKAKYELAKQGGRVEQEIRQDGKIVLFCAMGLSPSSSGVDPGAPAKRRGLRAFPPVYGEGKMSIHPDLNFKLKHLARVIYFVTDEEDRFLVDLKEALATHADRAFVYSATMGLQKLENLINDWKTAAHPEDRETLSIHDALVKVYKEDPRDKQNFYVFTDPERWLSDAHVVRRFLNIIHQVRNDVRKVKLLIFVGSRKVVPEKLSRYVQVVQDTGLSREDMLKVVETTAAHLKITDLPPNTADLFRGMTSYEIDQSICASVVATKKDAKGKRIDPEIIRQFRKDQLAKTDLVTNVDVSKFSFSQVGGAGRFKEWAEKTRATWTPAGEKFGLVPPKGVLCVGVWGCGKSLSVKAMGAAWGLPVVQLEMGKLRSSGVGESEANVYRAIRIIESVSPCLVWIDEAEKSLSGNASSGQTDAGTTSRTIGILSTWLQETSAKVCLAMTANSLNGLPVEFVNRMDERFFFDLPAEEDRIDILKIHLSKRGQSPEDFNLAELAQAGNGLVGREIEQAIGAALVDSFHAKKDGLDEAILAQALKTKPRILKTMGDEVKAVIQWVGYDPEADDGIRARFASKPDKQGSMKVLSGG